MQICCCFDALFFGFLCCQCLMALWVKSKLGPQVKVMLSVAFASFSAFALAAFSASVSTWISAGWHQSLS